MKKRIAILDLGTNTFHLLIAEVVNQQVARIVRREQRHARLGQGGINKGVIIPAAFERGLQALRDFSNVIKEEGVAEVHAAGTAALRGAENGPSFIEEAYRQTGISIQVIDGEREAELIYRGVSQSLPFPDSALIMDIGGGSVEFIFCSAREIFSKKSYPIGAARLMEQFHHSDPISPDDIHAVQMYLNDALSDLKEKAALFKPEMLVGSAGAFETFAALNAARSTLQQEKDAASFSFEYPQLQAVFSDILRSTHAQRAANELIPSVRTDMIVVAALLAKWVIESLLIRQVVLSTYSLKEGLLFDRAARSS